MTNTHTQCPSGSLMSCTQKSQISKIGEKNDDARVWQDGEMESSSLRV